MSDVITNVGPHEDRDGERCEVKWIGDGIAIGFDSDGDPTCWNTKTGAWRHAGDTFRCNIVGPWHEPPAPPEGFQVMPKDYVAKRGVDRVYQSGSISNWRVVEGLAGMSAEMMLERFPEQAPHYVASPIPKPTVEPGEGWRLLNDEEVIQDGDEMNSVRNPPDEGWLPVDVRHIGRTQSYIMKHLRIRRRVTQPEWKPTDDYIQLRRWTCGDKSEWRVIEVTP